MAAALADLGVDVIEAGTIASEGFDRPRGGAHGRGVKVAALARACAADIARTAAASRGRPPRDPHLHRHQRHPLSATSCASGSRCSTRRPRPSARAPPRRRGGVLRRGRDAEVDYLCAVAAEVVAAGRAPSTSRHRRLLRADEFSASCRAWSPRWAGGHGERALPQRPRAGGGQLAAAVQAGARQVECTINGIGERAGNARSEIVVVLRVRPTACLDTNVDTPRRNPASRLLRPHRRGTQPNKDRRPNAFARRPASTRTASSRSGRPTKYGPRRWRARAGCARKAQRRHALRKRWGTSVASTPPPSARSTAASSRADRKKGVTDERSPAWPGSGRAGGQNGRNRRHRVVFPGRRPPPARNGLLSAPRVLVLPGDGVGPG